MTIPKFTKGSKCHTISEAKIKIAKYCTYQERCHQEVRDKLYSLDLHKDEVESLIVDLIQQNFVNEERYAKSYCRGKFRYKNWGRVKISMGLKQKKISDYCIKKGLAEISDKEYHRKLEGLIEKERSKVNSLSEFAQNQKIASSLMRKGYEGNLVWEALKG